MSGKPKAKERGHAKYDRDFPSLGWRRRKDLRVKVYVLVDPRDLTVRYVGQTISPKMRRSAHRGSAGSGNRLLDTWKRELKALGLRPLFAVVDSADDERANELEGSWIAYYRHIGRLHNVASTGGAVLRSDPTDTELDDALRRLKRAQRKQAQTRMREIESFLSQDLGRKERTRKSAHKLRAANQQSTGLYSPRSPGFPEPERATSQETDSRVTKIRICR